MKQWDNVYTTYRLRLKINEKCFAWLFKSSGKESYLSKVQLKNCGPAGIIIQRCGFGRMFKSQCFVVHGWSSLPQSLLLWFESFFMCLLWFSKFYSVNVLFVWLISLCVPVPRTKGHKDPGFWLFRCLFNCPVLQQRNLAKTPHRAALYKHSWRLQAQSESCRLLFGSDKTEIPLCNKLNHALFQLLPNFKWLSN